MSLAKRLSPVIWECTPFQSSQTSYLSPGALHTPFLFIQMPPLNSSQGVMSPAWTHRMPAAFGVCFHQRPFPILIGV